MKIPENVKNAINEMFSCNHLMEHLACYHKFHEELKECTFVVFSENEGTKLPKPLCTNYDQDFAIINIGCANQYYAVNRKIYEEMIRTGKSDYNIDVCVELDTQAVSYLKNIFRDYNQVLDYNKIEKMIAYLKLNKVDYSCIPYLVENAVKKDHKIDCYENIKSFMLFKAFDYSAFLQKGICVYHRQEEDLLIDTDNLYNDMFSDHFMKGYEKFYRMQKSLYILLLQAIYIEFTNPRKSAQNKIMELFDFVNDKLGFVAERELEVCYYYFKHDDKTKKFFKRIQKNSKGLLNTINGMAWDFTHIRLIEQEFTIRPIDKVIFAIHVLLTFDNGLKEILQINPIEQIVFYKEIPIPKFKHRWLEQIPGAVEKLYSEKHRQRRWQTFETMDADQWKTVLEEELRKVQNLKVFAFNRV